MEIQQCEWFVSISVETNVFDRLTNVLNIHWNLELKFHLNSLGVVVRLEENWRSTRSFWKIIRFERWAKRVFVFRIKFTAVEMMIKNQILFTSNANSVHLYRSRHNDKIFSLVQFWTFKSLRTFVGIRDESFSIDLLDFWPTVRIDQSSSCFFHHPSDVSLRCHWASTVQISSNSTERNVFVSHRTPFIEHQFHSSLPSLSYIF